MIAPRRGQPPIQGKANCVCGTARELEFECIPCCLRWLSKMDRDTMALNAPVIGIVAGQEHLQAVREAFKQHVTAKNAATTSFQRRKI